MDITSNTEALKRVRKSLYKTGWKVPFVWSIRLEKMSKTKKVTNITVTTSRRLRGAGIDNMLGDYQILFVEDGMTV
jgi:G:T-mismatch repair DNA endonuclease (very short patch repair protein)